MNYKMKQAILVILFFLSATILKAQQSEAAKELALIRQFYAGHELKHIKGVMLLKAEDNGAIIDRVNFEYWSKDSLLFTKMNYIEILSNRSFYIMANHRYRTIYVRRVNDKFTKPASGFLDADQIKALLTQKGVNVSLSKGEGMRKLVISGLQNSKFSSLTISYASHDHSIKAIEGLVEADGNDKRKILSINYNTTEKIVLADESFFSASHYVHLNKGQISYTKTYQDYKKL